MTRTRTRRPTNCTRCGVRLRGNNDPYVPGTRRHEGRGMCGLCWKREKYGSQPRPDRPPTCTLCERGWDAVRYCARGLCTGCYGTVRYQEVRERTRQPMPAACVRCGDKLRHRKAPPAEGTAPFAGRGMCATCYARQVRHERSLLAYVLGGES